MLRISSTHLVQVIHVFPGAISPVSSMSEAMATALGLRDLRPLVPAPTSALDKITTYVPQAQAESVRAALAEAGAGHIGDYDCCSFSTPGEGRFRPLEGATPTIGQVGRPEVVSPQ